MLARATAIRNHHATWARPCAWLVGRRRSKRPGSETRGKKSIEGERNQCWRGCEQGASSSKKMANNRPANKSGAKRSTDQDRRQSSSNVVKLVISAAAVLILSRTVQWWVGQQSDDPVEAFTRPLPAKYAVCSKPLESTSSSQTVALTTWATNLLNQILAPSASIHSLSGKEGSGLVDCFIVEDGELVHSGDSRTVQSWCQSHSCDVRIVPPGYTVQPSFTDAHGHLLALGQSLLSVDLQGATSLAECIARIESFIDSHPTLRDDADKWIIGNGWDQTRWNDTDGKSFPTSADLASSPALRDRKISLKRIDFHALWLSPAAMQAVEANGNLTPEPISGGLVVRDPQNGEPTGILVDNAMQLALDVIPPWTDEDRREYLTVARDLLFSHGITGVGDAAASVEDLDFYLRAEADGSLILRVYAFLACPTGKHYCAEDAQRHLSALTTLPLRNADVSSRLTIRTVKLFADGALGSWGSAMWEPYSDRPDERGLLLMEPGEVTKIVRYWHDRGWQVATHAIGDRANSIVLNAYDELVSNATALDIRPRIEHAQLLKPSDIARFNAIGVIASMQPTHCTSDFYYVADRIGDDRAANGAYAWSSVVKSGAKLVFGSDFPVESPNVLEGIWAAVSRLDRSGNSPFGRGVPWYGKEAIPLPQAVRAFTVEPAYVQFQDAHLGSLEAGKRADFVLTKGDLLAPRLRDPREVEVVATALEGQWVWRRC